MRSNIYGTFLLHMNALKQHQAWVRRILRNNQLVPIPNSIYWRYTGSAGVHWRSFPELGEIVREETIVHRVILKSNGVRLPIYGIKTIVFFAPQINDRMWDWYTQLQLRRQKRNSIERER